MLYEIFHENRKIKFALLSGCLTFMNRVEKKKNKKKKQKKTANKETNKTQYNSFYLILFFKIMRCHEH